MNALSKRSGALFLAGLSVIAAAWWFELIGGYIPCALCLEQRLGYYIALPLLLLVFFSGFILRPDKSRPGFYSVGAVLLIAGLAFFWSAGLGVYQAGAEWGFWPGPSGCGGGAQMDATLSLQEAMTASRIVPCDEPALRLFGLSLAGMNALAAGALGVGCGAVSAWFFRRIRTSRQKAHQGSSSVSQ
jgi:disulfide bond formation protein DsbB